MEITMRKIGALLQNEIKLFLKNKNVLLLSFLPIVFSLIYSRIFGEETVNSMGGNAAIMFLCVTMNIVLVAAFIMAMLIAEEKEKNTLRTLMLSGISPIEFLIGKVILTFFITTISNIFIYVIFSLDVSYLGGFLLFTSSVVIIMLIVGAVIGILSPNLMSTGVIGMPMLMVLFAVPMFAPMNKTLEMIARFIPSYALQLLLKPILSGKALGADSLMNIFVILGWIVLSILAFIFTYHKVGLDK